MSFLPVILSRRLRISVVASFVCHSRRESAFVLFARHSGEARISVLAFALFVIPEGNLLLSFLLVILAKPESLYWPLPCLSFRNAAEESASVRLPHNPEGARTGRARLQPCRKRTYIRKWRGL